MAGKGPGPEGIRCGLRVDVPGWTGMPCGLAGEGQGSAEIRRGTANSGPVARIAITRRWHTAVRADRTAVARVAQSLAWRSRSRGAVARVAQSLAWRAGDRRRCPAAYRGACAPRSSAYRGTSAPPSSCLPQCVLPRCAQPREGGVVRAGHAGGHGSSGPAVRQGCSSMRQGSSVNGSVDVGEGGPLSSPRSLQRQ